MVASKTGGRRRATVDVFVGDGVKGDHSGFVIGRVEVLLVVVWMKDDEKREEGVESKDGTERTKGNETIRAQEGRGEERSGAGRVERGPSGPRKGCEKQRGWSSGDWSWGRFGFDVCFVRGICECVCGGLLMSGVEALRRGPSFFCCEPREDINDRR